MNFSSANIQLYHHGIKGMKWGVRRTKAQLGHRTTKTTYSTIKGHSSPPRKSTPNSIIDRINPKGKLTCRTFYDENGNRVKDIHLSNHGNNKHHNYTGNGEHVVMYEWNLDGSIKNKHSRELTRQERKENDDIL